MAGSHIGRCPKRDDETEHDRMTHKVIKRTGLETQLRVFHSATVQVDLTQAEKFEVIDHESAQQDREPAHRKNRPQDPTTYGVLDTPDHARDGPPLPE